MLHGQAGAGEEHFSTQGIGRPSLLPLGQIYDPAAGLPKAVTSDSILLPYSATPPPSFINQRAVVDVEALTRLKESFGNLWSLPFDHRLDFIFQSIHLCSHGGTPSAGLAVQTRFKLGGLEKAGGSFSVYDIDNQGNSAHYGLNRRYSAADAEEILLQIPPSRFSMAASGTDLNYSFVEPFHTAPWRRLM